MVDGLDQNQSGNVAVMYLIHRRRPVIRWATAALVAVSVAGCGGSSDGGKPVASEVSPEEAVRTVFVEYWDARNDDDSERACNLMEAKARAEHQAGLDRLSRSIESAPMKCGHLFDAPGVVTVDNVDVDGSVARVTATSESGMISTRLLKTADGWRVQDGY